MSALFLTSACLIGVKPSTRYSQFTAFNSFWPRSWAVLETAFFFFFPSPPISFFLSGVFLYFWISYLIYEFLYDAIIFYIRYNPVYSCLFLLVSIYSCLFMSVPIYSCLLQGIIILEITRSQRYLVYPAFSESVFYKLLNFFLSL